MNKVYFLALVLGLLLLIARADTARGYALETSSSGVDLAWPNGTITMNLQLNSASIPYPNGVAPTDGSASWNAVAQASLAEWNQYLENVQFVSNTNTLTPTNGDGINSVFFSSTAFGQGFGADAIAVTLILYHTSTNKMAETDIVVNTAYSWDSYRGPLMENYLDGEYTYDLRRVLDHELGHVLGLNHPDLASPPQTVTAIMNSTIGDLDHIALDDTQGAMFLYGQKTVDEPITVVASPSNCGTVTGGGNLPLGSTQQLIAIPAPGCDFIAWEDSSTSLTRSIVVPTEGGTYTATFAAALDDWRGRDDPVYGLYKIFFANGQFFSTSEDFNTVSPDGVNWTASSVPYLAELVYGNGTYVGIESGTIYTSTDGVTWNNATSLIGATTSIAYGNGVFVVTGNAANSTSPTPIMTSTDGVNWSATTSGLTGYNLGAVTYGDGRFVALGYNNNTDADDVSLVSYDGVTWTSGDLGGFYELSLMAYGNGLFVASGGTNGAIFHSSDGFSWAQVSPPGANSSYTGFISSIAYGNGTYIALQYGNVLSSTDAITWSVRTHPTEYAVWNNVVFGNNTFVSINEDVLYQSGTVPPLTSPPILPAIDSGLTALGHSGDGFSYQIAATNSPLAFNALGLPAGLSVNVQTGAISGTPMNTGSFPVTLLATNDEGSQTATLTLDITAPVVPMTFSTWEQVNNFTGDPGSTPKGDSVPNLMKYFYDINPNSTMTPTDRAALPALGTASSGSVLTLTFRENKDLESVGVSVESSTDLQTWSTPTGAVIVPTGATDSSTGDPMMQAQVPVTSGTQFIRLLVTPQ